MIWRTRSGATGSYVEARLAACLRGGTHFLFGGRALGDFADESRFAATTARVDVALFDALALIRRAPSCRPLRLGWRGAFPRGIVPPYSCGATRDSWQQR